MPIPFAIIGCGVIANTYARMMPHFSGVAITACADLSDQAAGRLAAEHGFSAMTPDALMDDPDIDIVMNLTVPNAHFDVSARAIAAGKHVYSEKPLAANFADGAELLRLADANNVRVGCAPDTFMGGALQWARVLIDGDRIGPVASGTCHVMGPGMEHWHPNPVFFFQPGGGPVLDMAPYYLTALVHLIGPVRRVAAMGSIAQKSRTVTALNRMIDAVDVSTPTTQHCVLEFANDAIVTLGASWDVQAHTHPRIELYGRDGSLGLPDPNFFDGTVTVADREVSTVPEPWTHPLLVVNHQGADGSRANYRGIGIADMADAIAFERPHRCNGALALHVLEVMEAINRSGNEHRFIDIETSCERPAPFGPEEAAALMV